MINFDTNSVGWKYDGLKELSHAKTLLSVTYFESNAYDDNQG